MLRSSLIILSSVSKNHVLKFSWLNTSSVLESIASLYLDALVVVEETSISWIKCHNFTPSSLEPSFLQKYHYQWSLTNSLSSVYPKIFFLVLYAQDELYIWFCLTCHCSLAWYLPFSGIRQVCVTKHESWTD